MSDLQFISGGFQVSFMWQNGEENGIRQNNKANTLYHTQMKEAQEYRSKADSFFFNYTKRITAQVIKQLQI